MVPRALIAVDGVSLTLVDVEAERFSVVRFRTRWNTRRSASWPSVGAWNLETDLLAKYAQKQNVDLS